MSSLLLLSSLSCFYSPSLRCPSARLSILRSPLSFVPVNEINVAVYACVRPLHTSLSLLLNYASPACIEKNTLLIEGRNVFPRCIISTSARRCHPGSSFKLDTFFKFTFMLFLFFCDFCRFYSLISPLRELFKARAFSCLLLQ